MRQPVASLIAAIIGELFIQLTAGSLPAPLVWPVRIVGAAVFLVVLLCRAPRLATRSPRKAKTAAQTPQLLHCVQRRDSPSRQGRGCDRTGTGHTLTAEAEESPWIRTMLSRWRTSSTCGMC